MARMASARTPAGHGPIHGCDGAVIAALGQLDQTQAAIGSHHTMGMVDADPFLTEPASACTGEIFSDGFESGDTSAWD